jgi:hypothetical protein
MAIRSPRVPAAIFIIACALVACGGSASEDDGPTAGSTPVGAQARSAAPEPSAPGDTASLSGPLGDLVPDQIGGFTLRKETVAGPDIGDLDPADAESFAALLKNVDGSPESFSAVTALGPGIAIAAMRMEGTDGGQLGDAMVGVVLDAAEGDAPVADVTVAGKMVKRITPADATPIHVYVIGEVMFVVQADDPALVEEALAALP